MYATEYGGQSSWLTNLALSRTPAKSPDRKAAQLSCPKSDGTEMKAFVSGVLSWIMSVGRVEEEGHGITRALHTFVLILG